MTKKTISNAEQYGEVYPLLKGYYDGENKHNDIEIVEMTGEEEEAISKGDIKSNGGKVVRTVLERCIVRIGTLTKRELGQNKWRETIQSLSVGDQDFALLKIREITLGNEIELTHSCPKCRQELKTIIDTNELEITPFNGVEVMQFELPKGYTDSDGNKYVRGTLRYPTGADREILDPIARTNVGVANTMMLTRCITEFDGLKAYDQVVRKLSLKDRDYLLNILKDNTFGIDLKTEVTCSECGYTFKGNLSTANFI